jgi:hypothetical protein
VYCLLSSTSEDGRGLESRTLSKKSTAILSRIIDRSIGTFRSLSPLRSVSTSLVAGNRQCISIAP